MYVMNDSPKVISLPCKINGKPLNCEFKPGKNEIDPETWKAIKGQNAARFEAYYGVFLREWKTIKPTKFADELTGGPLSQFARPEGFESLSMHDALELISNTSCKQLLVGYIEDETRLGKNRREVKETARKKISQSAEFRSDMEREIREANEIERRYQADHRTV